MNCLRCGKPTGHSSVFCETCLQDMEKHPVKPDTAIHLPKRAFAEQVKKPSARKKPLSAEELVPLLRKRNRRLTAFCLLLLVLLGVCAGLLLNSWLQPEEPQTPESSYYTSAQD